MEEIIDLIIGSQQPDGYINSHFSVVNQDKRWTHLQDHHELYCAGHLMEAAVAHFKLTQDSRSLDAMEKILRFN